MLTSPGVTTQPLASSTSAPSAAGGPGERADGGDGAALDEDVAVELAAVGVHGDDAGVADEKARHGILRAGRWSGTDVAPRTVT